jgi:transcriptional regulator with XRE-family HTH domain
MAFAKTLKQLMNKNHYTQLSLSKVLGIRQSQVHNWLYGKSFPNYFSIGKLCEVFHISADMIINIA